MIHQGLIVRYVPELGKGNGFINHATNELFTADPYSLMFAISGTFDEKVSWCCTIATDRLKIEIEELAKKYFK